jgi:enoyl-CoA hydratase/carnithine racemase
MSASEVVQRGPVSWVVLADGDEKAPTTLVKALRDAERDRDVRCLVLRGTRFDVDATSALIRLRASPLPTVAAWTADVRGAGAALVLACDIRVAADEASVHFAPAEPPAAFPAGLSWQLARTIGRGRAFELLTSGSALSADELLRLGLVSGRTAAAELDGAVEALAAGLATRSRTFAAGVKRSLNFAEQVDFDESVEFDRLIDFG